MLHLEHIAACQCGEDRKELDRADLVLGILIGLLLGIGMTFICLFPYIDTNHTPAVRPAPDVIIMENARMKAL